jgi:3-deoxy-D-manno-octulosonate 8-phosphate phosphatase (KDO 8-P phosphatase)
MSYLDLFPPIKAFVFDVDGVLTNGQVVLLPGGQQMRQMHSKDGYALQLAVKMGYHVGIITGGKSEEVKQRLLALGITSIYLGASHKDDAIEDFKFSHGLSFNEIMYMGDDIPDLGALHLVGLPACPSDACQEVRSTSHYVSKLEGGQGCVRDIIEMVMRAQDKWYDKHDDSKLLADFTW